jgi:hypothetical protein
MLNFVLIVLFFSCSINCGIDDWDAMLQAESYTGSTPNDVNDFFRAPDPSSHTMALGFTERLTEKSTRRFLGVQGDRLTD